MGSRRSSSSIWGLVLGLVVLVTVWNSQMGFVNGQNFNFVMPNFTFRYDDVGFLRTPLINDFCAPVPNPPSMMTINPSDFLDAEGKPTTDGAPCSQGKFLGAVILSVLGSLTFVVIILSCLCICPCVCFLR